VNLSIVIPAFNEAPCIATTLHAVRRQSGTHEVIVVDGGSEDDTAALAAPLARVIQAPRGRARQMNAGAAIAGGDTLLFVPARGRHRGRSRRVGKPGR
jgi:glycosyltransferase involved in cell wall biosynthesis